jgi:deoxycytidylate deaminase
MKSIPNYLQSDISEKFIKKTMRLTKQLGEDSNPCLSRQIGCMVIDKDGKIKASGYNGPPRKTPHVNSPEYTEKYLLPKLTQEERKKLESFCEIEYNFQAYKFCSKLENCQTCPRKILGYKSGERLDLCSCVHAEANTIISATTDLTGLYLFAYCPVSCLECTKIIIQAGLREVHFLDSIYDKSSLVLYGFANIPIFLYSPEELS